MKLLLGLLLLASAAQAEPATVHGMAVVSGGGKIFLSHLPMFHHPHDQQALLEAELDPAAVAAYQASRQSSKETVYTLVPEEFVLSDMLDRPVPFTAELFVGHFERGGKRIAAHVKVQIKRVVFRAPLKASTPQPEVPQYLLFGAPEAPFLAHLISGAPDFDQLLAVTPNGSLRNQLGEKGTLKLGIPSGVKPLVKGAYAMVHLPEGTKEALKVDESLYTEFGDLAH